MPSTEIATVPAGTHLAFNHSADEREAVIAANLGDTQLTEGNLPRVKVPTGGATTWTITGPFGDESSRELTGILVYWKRNRSYWPSKKLTGEPPACTAPDNKHGEGSPGGLCRDCPMNQWKSAALILGNDSDAAGKACKEREIWFLLRENSMLPLVLSLSPSSLRNAEKYRIGYSGAMIPLESVQTTITLEQKTGPEGPYAVAVPTFSGQLIPEERQAAAEYAASMRPLFEAHAAAMATETPDGPEPARGDVDLDAEAA